MNLREDHRLPIGVAIILTAANVLLVWSYRFLPLGDYAIWLFVAKILRAIQNPLSLYGSHYDVIAVPVPNLTFTLAALGLSYVLSLEMAGKVIMTLLVLSFPWSVWYSFRALAPHPDPALGYLGFPFFFNMFMFGSQNYLLGLSMALWAIGFFVPRFDRLTMRGWLLLALVLCLIYFTHAIPFVILLLLMLILPFFSGSYRWKRAANVGVSALPSVVCLLWYIASQPHVPEGSTSWGLETIVRNVFKPLLLFTKSYGITTPLPLTVLNAAWLLVLLCLAIALVRRSLSAGSFDRRFSIPSILLVPAILFMPSVAAGITQPGARFVFPLLFFAGFWSLRVPLSAGWKIPLLAFSCAVTLFNFNHFRNVNDQSAAFHRDLVTHVDVVEPFYVLRYDWSTEETLRNRLSMSVDPLSLVPYYACLERDCICWIHETALVQLKPESAWYRPDIGGATVPEFYSSVMAHREGLRRFRALIVLGSGEEAQQTIRAFQAHGYRPLVTRPLWSILHAE